MNNKTLLLTLSFTLGTLFTNAQSLPGFQWGEGMGTPDLSWTAQVGAKTYPKGKIFQAADYGLKNDSTRLSTAALQKAIDECHRSGGGTVEVAPGYYRIGAIYLKSNVNLHLNQGTTLIASENIDLYPEMRFPRGRYRNGMALGSHQYSGCGKRSYQRSRYVGLSWKNILG